MNRRARSIRRTNRIAGQIHIADASPLPLAGRYDAGYDAGNDAIGGEGTTGVEMTQVIIENPILNSPYLEPTRHFMFSDEGISNEQARKNYALTK